MEGDLNIPIDDPTWGERRDKLRELESVNRPHWQTNTKWLVNRQLRDAVKKGEVEEFIDALRSCTAEQRVSLSDVFAIEGPSGNSLLHVAAGIEKADILRALLEVIPDERSATVVNDRLDTALHVAARAGRIDTAKLLLNYGSIVDMENDAGNTALHEAVKNRHYDFTVLLLRKGSKQVNKENKESKSPLYLAVEAENSEILKLLMDAVDANEVLRPRMEGMSPVHGAVIHRSRDMLQLMLGKKELFDLTDAGSGTPLHLAAYVNYVDGVKFLLSNFPWSAFVKDQEGYLPIHVACKMGHLETIEELLKHWPDPEELLTFNEGQNILHVGAKYGRASVVKYMLGDPKLEKLINTKDKEGNTPFHLATLQWQNEVLFSLTRHERIDLGLVNNGNLTALDIVDEQLKKIDAPFRESLTRIILMSARATRSKDRAICQRKGLGLGRDVEPPNLDRLKDQANTRMVVAALVATMTFAAGFSVPGGYNGSEPDAGFATMLNKPMYNVFVICNSIAMYSSIISVVILLWTQINDWHAVHHALRNAKLPLLIALATMSMAFMAGTYVTTSKRTWLAIVALIVGVTALFIILGLYIALFLPLWYNCRLVQLFSDFIIKAGISISRSVTQRRATRRARFRKPNEKSGQPNSLATNLGDENEWYDAPEAFL